MPGIVFILEVYTPVREFGSGSDKKKKKRGGGVCRQNWSKELCRGLEAFYWPSGER